MAGVGDRSSPYTALRVTGIRRYSSGNPIRHSVPPSIVARAIQRIRRGAGNIMIDPLSRPVVTDATRPAWFAAIIARSRKLFWLKLLGTTLFTWAFFVGYFHVLRNPAHDVTPMPLTELDGLVEFAPSALLAYVSLWFYVGVPPGLLVSFRELVHYGLWIGGLCIAGLACFYFWPTSVPPHGIELVDFPGFGLLRGIDASANACPSMHVATATFSAIWLDCLLREIGMRVPARFLNGCWFALIVYSTLAIKQHVVLDVIAGLALGIAFAWPSLRLRRLLARYVAA